MKTDDAFTEAWRREMRRCALERFSIGSLVEAQRRMEARPSSGKKILIDISLPMAVKDES